MEVTKNAPDLAPLSIAKVQPQAIDAEAAVLGAILLNNGTFEQAAELLHEDCFYLDANRAIFKAMRQVRAAYTPIDVLSVMRQMMKTGDIKVLDGPHTLTALTNSIVTTNIDTHAKAVYQKYILRRCAHLGGWILNAAYASDADCFEILEKISIKISEMSLADAGGDYTTFIENAEIALKEIRKTRETGNALTGVPSGIIELDYLTRGWQPTDLICIAARPAVGKSALAANLARGAVLHPKYPKRVGIFSLEMSSHQWVQRIITAASEVDGMNILRGKVSDAEMAHIEKTVYQGLGDIPIFLDDTAGLSIQRLKNKARKMVAKDKVDMIIIDYLQLMSSDVKKGNREQEVSTISRELKQLAKELKIPIIELSQLSRAGNDEPNLTHLRESGAIEQDADIVIVIYAVDETGESEDPAIKNGIFLKFLKHRNGALGKVAARFVKPIQKIFPSESDYEQYMAGYSNFKPPHYTDYTQPKSEATLTIQGQRVENFETGFDEKELF